MSPARFWWRVIRVPLVALLGAGILGVSAAYTMVDRLLYYPDYGSRRAPAGMQKIASEAGGIAVLHLPNPKAEYTIWFFHGNAEDLGDLEPFLLMLREKGFAVFAFDYPGYGLSGGKPNEQSLYAASRAARRHLHEVLRVPAERVLVFGRSVGGGPAVQMAMEERPAGLILQSTFVSVFRVMTRWRILPFDQFENLKKIPRVACPVLVMHGREDEVIPFRHGEALFAAAREPKRSFWVAGARHNDFLVVAGDSFWNALRDFSALCAGANASQSRP